MGADTIPRILSISNFKRGDPLHKIRWKEVGYALAFLLLAALLAGLAGRALRPARTSFGAVWGPYLAEPKNSLDYLYLGSSYAYCDADPAVIYSETGLTGYVLAGPEQTLSQTYWYLREALRTQTPGVVVLEASALQFAPYQSYTQVNVGYMPAGLNRLGAVFSASEPELRVGLLFELYFYHDRWKEVTLGEIRAALCPPSADLLKGYTPVEGAFETSAEGPFLREVQPDEVYQKNLADLGRIAALCAERNVPLAVVLHPTYSQIPTETRTRMAADLAALGISFYDWTEDSAALGLDFPLHYYDPGHLNQSGAEIFSAWLGGFLIDELKLSPRTQREENAAAWKAAARRETPPPTDGGTALETGWSQAEGECAIFPLTQGKDGFTCCLEVKAQPSGGSVLTLRDADGQVLQEMIETDILEVDFQDVDLDGCADLSLSFGGTMNTPHKLYLWDPEGRRFQEVAFDGLLSYYEVYDGYLKNWCKSGPSSGIVQVLVWDENRLTVAEELAYQLEEKT